MNLRIYARALYFFNLLEHSNSFAGEFIISFAFLNIYDACLSEDSESFVAELEHYGGLKLFKNYPSKLTKLEWNWIYSKHRTAI
jgi:hypothetical protein